MSIKDHKKPFHRRNNSGELDVFEADRYFSGSNDNYTLLASANLSQKMASRDEKRGYLRQGRASLDVPSLKYYYLHQKNHPIVETKQHQFQQQQQQQNPQEKKKSKQPNSPSGKIAQFLNSLFNQTNSKKNKKKSMKSFSSTQSIKDEDQSPIRRRKRSSISHFWSTSSAIDTSSGFRTPPYNLNHHQPNIPLENRIWLKESDRQSISVSPYGRSYKDFRTFSEYKDVLGTLSKYKIQENGNPNVNGNGYFRDHDKIKTLKNLNHGYQQKTEHKKIVHEEYDHDGDESDSSSDLFELKIDYGFGFCSSGLPVYETTHMDNIKRSSSTSFTNGPIKA